MSTPESSTVAPAPPSSDARRQFHLRHVMEATALFAVTLGLGTQIHWELGVISGVLLAVYGVYWFGRITLVEVFVIIGLIGILVGLMLPAVTSAPRGGRRVQCQSNLRQIAIALHLYHEDYGSFPPAYTVDASGRPMHSWRVLILPYLEEAGLYKQYNLEEPWNSPNNLAVANQVPAIFQCPTVGVNQSGKPNLTTS
jgi:type II secretory pathway pseudopilin PulG